MPKRLKTGIVVWGTGGHAKVALDIMALCKRKVLCFIDDTATGQIATQFQGCPVYRNLHEVPATGSRDIFIAIGDNEVRHEKSAAAEKQGFRFISLIHPNAIIAQDVRLGRGTLVAAGGIINPGVRVGNGVIVNTSTSIDHDCTIEDGAHLSPGVRLAGHVRIGKRAWIGIGAVVIDKIAIGDCSIVGAGSVVIQNIPEGVVVAGVPAQVIRRCSQKPSKWEHK